MRDSFSAFVQTLTRDYGLSEQYADAAWYTVNERSRCNCGADLAHGYCRRFGILPVSATH